MSPLLLKVLQISLASAVLIAAVVLVRAVLLKAKCARGAILVLWAAVGIRLLLPVSVGSAVGILPGLTDANDGRASRQNMIVQEEDLTAVTMVPPKDGETLESAPTVRSFHIPVSPETWLLFAYLTGLAGLLIYYAVSFARLARIVRRARSLGDGIYASEEVDAAFVFGVFSPRIILPAGLPAFVCRVVVRHEDAHLRHGDHFWKPLAFFLLALHWFNPFVWLAYFLFVRDLEFACDDRAAQYLSVDGRKEYAEALLLLGTAARPVSIQAVAFGEGNVEQRIRSVCRRRRPAAVLSVIAVLLAVTLGALAMLHHEEGLRQSAATDTDQVTMVPMEQETALPDDPYRPVFSAPRPIYDVTETPAREN
jgi:beta-lactamase regulating signal transducer with metallopeptidase domain